MKQLPPPKRHDMSLEEAITFLAWGKTFTANNFAAADGLGHYRNMLAYFEKERAEIERLYKAAHGADSGKGDNSTETRSGAENVSADSEFPLRVRPFETLSKEELVIAWSNFSKSEAEYRRNVEQAMIARSDLEAMESGASYDSPEFFNNLSVAQQHLWEAIKGGTVVAFAKAQRTDSSWQQIDPRWFWDEPQPTSKLGERIIERGGSASSSEIGGRWYEVRFELPTVERLRAELTEERADAAVAAEPRVRRGGRPAKYDWDAFWVEVVRIANRPDGLPSVDGTINQPELQRMMQEWCLDKWGEEPSSSLLREKLAKLI